MYSKGRSLRNRWLALRFMPNALPLTRYGFSVSKRLGKAVARNRLKRRLRELARSLPVQPGWDIVVIGRGDAMQADFAVLRRALTDLLRRAGILESHRSTG